MNKEALVAWMAYFIGFATRYAIARVRFGATLERRIVKRILEAGVMVLPGDRILVRKTLPEVEDDQA